MCLACFIWSKKCAIFPQCIEMIMHFFNSLHNYCLPTSQSDLNFVNEAIIQPAGYFGDKNS